MRTNNEYQTTRIWTKTLKRLRLIAAMTNESMVEVIDRLSKQEMQQVQERETMMELSEQCRTAIHQLKEIDKIILEESLNRRYRGATEDNFTSLLNQKDGLIDLIKRETGRTPHWTAHGYNLR